MDFRYLLPARARLWLAVALATSTLLAGCSQSSQELRTPAQSAGFVVEVASGEPYGSWELANDASQQAARAWAARAAIGDLGHWLRDASPVQTAGSIQPVSWSCEMTRKLIGLGTVGGITSFNGNDLNIVTSEALSVGVKRSNISAVIHDASAIPFLDLALATADVCGPPVS